MGDSFACKARAGFCDPPQDCDWPYCGCDEKANRVIERIEEGGGVVVGAADLVNLARIAAKEGSIGLQIGPGPEAAVRALAKWRASRGGASGKPE